MDKDNAIVVFARHPTPGRVKTRLAAGVGNDGAARFYKHCAEKVIQECLKTNAATYIFFSCPEEEEHVRSWLSPLDINNTLQFLPQVQSPDLGTRLADALHRTFFDKNFETRRHHHRVAVIGTDVPDLSSLHLTSAFTALERNSDVVFGPAEDGGYYLCALNAPLENQKEEDVLRIFFDNITWSTETVLQQNIDNASRLGLNVAPLDTLSTLRDIDTIDDLAEWCHRDSDLATPSSAAATEGVKMVGVEVLQQAETAGAVTLK